MPHGWRRVRIHQRCQKAISLGEIRTCSENTRTRAILVGHARRGKRQNFASPESRDFSRSRLSRKLETTQSAKVPPQWHCLIV